MRKSNKNRSQEKVVANTTFAPNSNNHESEKSFRRCNFHSGFKITTPENMLKAYIFASIYKNIYLAIYVSNCQVCFYKNNDILRYLS